jgi:hypothetical protein
MIYFKAFLRLCAQILSTRSRSTELQKCTIICNIFGYIQQTVDSVDGPNNQNQTLFDVNCLLDWLFLKFHLAMDPGYCMKIFEMKSRLVVCYHRIKLVLSLARQNFEQFRRMCNPFGFWLLSRVCGTQRKLNIFNNKKPCNIRKHVAFASVKWAQSLLHKVKGHSWSMAPRASVKSFCKNGPDRESSQSSVLPSTKRRCYLYTVDKASAFVPYTDKSLVWISPGLRLLRVKERTTVLCSIKILSTHAYLFFKRSG